MRAFAVGDGKPLKLTPEQRVRLKNTLVNETRRSLDGRYALENTWREDLRQYEGQPAQRVGWVPFENAPYTEITVGASNCDTVLGQSESLIFSDPEPLIVRSRKDRYDPAADAVQELINWGVDSGIWNFESGIKATLIDDIMLGTMVAYVPYTRTFRITDVRQLRTFGPKIRAIPIEDFILPANATKDIQEARFCTMRTYMSKAELAGRRKMNGWALDDAAGADADSMVRKDRMRTGGLAEDSGQPEPQITIGLTYIYFDLFDGLGERDIEVVWNMTSGGILKARYNPYNCRPFELECYQDRAHLAYGLGVMRMDSGYQKMCSDIWNNHVWNMMISNTKMYQMPEDMMGESEEIYPGKRFGLTGTGEIKAIDMGNVNNSGPAAFEIVSGLAKDRVGVGDLTGPIGDVNRTPVGSIGAVFQQANRRFTHPFNNMRNFAARCVMQCLYRIQERVRAGDKDVISQLIRILDADKAALVVDLMRRSDVELTDALDVQLTAASVSVNIDADRQNATILATQVLPLYWNAKKELAQYKAQPPFPGADGVADEADKMLDKVFHQIMKTFDQISDPRAFEISLAPIDAAMQKLGSQTALGPQMTQALGGAPGGAPSAPVPPVTLQ